MNYKLNRIALPVVSIALAMSMSACGSKQEPQEATQVAAKVGSEEISVHQINQILMRTNTKGASTEAVAKLSREVLDKLIDQQLAVNEATETKLNRTPDVMAQVEAARKEILARAYTQKVASTAQKPSAEEVQAYYTTHPELFAERRIFNIQELSLKATPDVIKQLQEFSATGKSLEELGVALKAKNIQFSGGSASKAAEQLPLELLAKVHALKDGQSLVIETQNVASLLRVASSTRAPIAQDVALKSIEQYLSNKRAGDAVAANLKDLKAKTQIAYMGEFAKTASASVEKPADLAVSAAKPADATKQGKSTLDSGVAGLK